MRRTLLCSGLVLAALACSKPTEPTEVGDRPDPLAGRTHSTIVYGGNLWGDLLECG